MTTPYLDLDDTSVGKFSLPRQNENTKAIEAALYRKRADLPDRLQLGAEWFTVPSTQKDWDSYSEDLSGNKVIRHGIWAMVEMQFISKRALTLGASGNTTNLHIATLNKGYRPRCTIGLTALNSNLDAVVEFNTNGNCYITSYNHTSTTIPKGTLLRIGGRYVYNP